jgi:hypothetical protein
MMARLTSHAQKVPNVIRQKKRKNVSGLAPNEFHTEYITEDHPSIVVAMKLTSVPYRTLSHCDTPQSGAEPRTQAVLTVWIRKPPPC